MTVFALPALELAILLPLGFALIAIMAGRAARHLIWIAGPAMIGVSALLAAEIMALGPVARAAGGWEAPLGVVLRADGLAVAFLVSSSVAMALIGLFALDEFAPPPTGEDTRSYAFWPLFYAMQAALNAVFLGADLFNLYVALELLTLAAVAMAGFGALGPALRYFMAALLGSLAYLLGAALLYAAHGALDIALLSERIEPSLAVWLAIALMTAGLMAKTALFPLHAWLPPAHAAAPAPASALLSALVIKASFLIVFRLWFDVMPGLAGAFAVGTLGALGAAAVLYGSIQAIRQTRLKPLIAYSTVAQLGYLFMVFPLASGGDDAPWAAGAWSGGVIHALSHLFAKAGMFLAAGLMIKAVADDRISALKGLARAMPLTCIAFALAAISLMGLPPSGGFMAKYLMLTSALAADAWLLALVMIVGGLLAAFYLFRPLAHAFAGQDIPAITPPARWRTAIPLILALIAVALGLVSAGPYEFIQIGRPMAAEGGFE